MKIEVGNYELDCDFDPCIQNNASDKTIPIDDIGFIYNCVFKQRKAFEYSVKSIKKVYPDSKIYVVSDGGYDYSYMEDENLKFSMEDDFKSALKNIGGDNFLLPEHQEATRKEMAATLRRLEKGIEVCGNPEWICMMEPDVLIRGRISHPDNAKLLGMRINRSWLLGDGVSPSVEGLKTVMGLNSLLSEIEGSIPVLRWGAVPVIFHTETFLKALKVYKDNFDIVDQFADKHYAPGTFDLFIGLIFALIGEQEVYNKEITECLRNPSWKTSNHPIVHQYREHYEDSDWVSKPYC
tara:strand:- start:144 stop:1025 length:882 start_codon:yes stop_codon:yes gene_type:complete